MDKKLNQQYTELCARLGDLKVRRFFLDQEIDKLDDSRDQINLEADKLLDRIIDLNEQIRLSTQEPKNEVSSDS